MRKSNFNQLGAIPLIILLFFLSVILVVFFSIFLDFRNKKFSDLNKNITQANSTLVSFNMGGSTCKLNIGPQGYQEITIGTLSTFSNTGYPSKGIASNIYKICKDQFLKDIQTLGQNKISTIIIWPLLSQFAYDLASNSYGSITLNGDGQTPNINNLDEFMDELAKNNIKARLTLNMMINGCGSSNHSWSNKEFYFNSNLVTDQAFQDQYIIALKEFVTRYKDHPALDSYDLGNEIAYIIRDKGVICEWTSDPNDDIKFDEPDLINFKNALSRMYQAVKEIDSTHPVTFSFGDPYTITQQTEYRDFFQDIVDFYDIHLYSQNPESVYQNLAPSYDKPLSHGEIGVADNDPFYDSAGLSCFGDDPLRFWTWQNDECQEKFLDNTKRWINEAKNHGATAIFFHSWPGSRRYGERVYLQGTRNTVESYRWTKAGQYILDYNAPTPTPTPESTTEPTPTPSISVTPQPTEEPSLENNHNDSYYTPYNYPTYPPAKPPINDFYRTSPQQKVETPVTKVDTSDSFFFEREIMESSDTPKIKKSYFEEFNIFIKTIGEKIKAFIRSLLNF